MIRSARQVAWATTGSGVTIRSAQAVADRRDDPIISRDDPCGVGRDDPLRSGHWAA
jgi:hypothetical protein